EPGQIDHQIRAVPDNANKGHRLLQIGEPGKDVWEDAFKELAGMTKLGKPRPTADVLARTKSGEPVYVVTKEDAGRAAAFGGEKYDVAKPRLRGGEYRGEFDQANAIGEYRIEVTGTGTGKEGKFSAGPVSARFTAFSEDVENQRPGADHKFLTQLATAGGGTFRLAGREELLQYLGELRERTAAAGWVKGELWPKWKYTPA